MINLRQLECFKILSEELNFTRAAEKLHMAQPPLSRQVKLLEQSLGVTLFERTKRMVRLTPEGEYLKKEIGKTFRQLDILKLNLKQIGSGQRGSLRLGYVGAAMHTILPGLLKKFLKHFPDVTLHLHEMDNTQQVEALKNGMIDIGFLRSRMEDDSIELIPVFEELFALIVPSNVKVKSTKQPDLLPLHDMSFIGFPKSCAPDMVNNIFSIMKKLKLSPKHIHESSQINSIVRMVEAGIGYSVLPCSVKDPYKIGLKILDLNNFNERAVLYAGVNTERRSAVVKNMLDMVSL